MEIDQELIGWINNNLNISLDGLSPNDAAKWEVMFNKKPEKFFSYAIYGFMRKRNQELGQEVFSEKELKRYCAEFPEKIRRVGKGEFQSSMGLPLFEFVGRTKMTAVNTKS